MARTISSATAGPINLQPADNPLTITTTGSVGATGSGLDAIDGSSNITWTIGNAGTVTSASGYGIRLFGAGTVSSSGSISGVDGVVVRGGGSVTNLAGGLISGFGALGQSAGSGSGVYITGGQGTVSNYGTISGNAYGVSLGRGGMVTN